MVELKGSLGGIGLPAIIQLIGELRHSGTLELAQGESTARLAFDDGRLIAAECGEYQGVQAVAASTEQLSESSTEISGQVTKAATIPAASAKPWRRGSARASAGVISSGIEASTGRPV